MTFSAKFTKNTYKEFSSVSKRLGFLLKKITLRKIVLVIYNWIALVYWQCVRLVKQFYNSLNLPLYILEGQGKDYSTALSFAYAGFYSWTLEYWAQAVLGQGFQKRSLGRRFIWEIIPLFKKEYPNLNFLLIENDSSFMRFFFRKHGLHVPHWAFMEIDISQPLEKLFGRQRLDVQRKIRQNSLTCQLSKELKDFNYFYHSMYLPYTKERHNDEAVVFTKQDLLNMFSRGELMFIKKGNECLSGGLVQFKKKNPGFSALGVLDGKWEYVRYGVISALYYFLIIELKKKGYQKVSIGGSRPIFSDGVTKYKISINAQLLPEKNEPGLRLVLLKNTPAFKDFLICNPLIIYQDKKPYRAIFVEMSKHYTQRNFDEIVKETSCRGLAGTELLVFDELKNLPDHIHFPKGKFRVSPAENLFINN
jgi:hypothetical protein